MMKLNIIALAVAGATVLMSLTGAPRAEAKMSKALNDTASTGMNALDYVLQKPLGNRYFENKKFGDKLFLSGGVGLSMFGDKPSRSFRPGFSGEISVGDWVTPTHGWRINIAGGTHSGKTGEHWKTFGSISADYLMNFSALLRGYNPSRPVEIIGVLGAEYQRTHYRSLWGNIGGFRAAIQARFNIQNNLYLYAEPRLGLYAGTRLPGDNDNRFRPNLSFNIGLGYRLLSKQERLAGATPFINNGDSHLFFGVGGGMWSFTRKTAFKNKTPYGFGGIYMGKYFSSAAGVRLKAEFGRIDNQSTTANRYLGIASLDFVWNLNAAFGGYRPDQIFDLSLNIGPALAYADKADAKFYPGAEAGLTALFRISPQWGIFIEPEVRLFSHKFIREFTDRDYGPFVSVMAGLRYTFGNFKYDNPESYKDFLGAKNNFLTFAVGGAKRWKGSYGKGISGLIGFGQRISPISSWRITAEGDIFSAAPAYLSVGLGADYMFSISTSMAGFNPDRIFDLSGFVGLTGGIAQYEGPVNGMIGARAGLHGDFRLSDALDLYIEPQLGGNTMFGNRNPGWTPEFRCMLGLKYKLGTPTGLSTDFSDTFLADGRNFVSLSGGPSFFSGTFVGAPRRVSGSIGVSAGRWFSNISGARIGYMLDIISTPNDPPRHPYINTLHADYLLNITSLMDRDPERRFHILGIVGTGVGFSNLHRAKAGFMLEGGGQFRYNLPSNIDIHIEPIVSFYPKHMMPNYDSGAQFVGVGRITGGLSYRF